MAKWGNGSAVCGPCSTGETAGGGLTSADAGGGADAGASNDVEMEQPGASDSDSVDTMRTEVRLGLEAASFACVVIG